MWICAFFKSVVFPVLLEIASMEILCHNWLRKKNEHKYVEQIDYRDQFATPRSFEKYLRNCCVVMGMSFGKSSERSHES